MITDWLNRLNVDKTIPIPLYYQIKQAILDLILEGTLTEGQLLPTEADFCNQCHISRPTIRQALSELVAEGYLYRQRAKGTFVAEPKIAARFLNELESFNEEMIQKGMKPKTAVLSLRVIKGSKNINEKLRIDNDADLIYLERLRFADGKPVVYLETCLPYKGFELLAEQDFMQQSLYNLLEKLYGIRVEKVVRKIEAVNATVRESGLLEMEKRDAVCLVRTIAYMAGDIPVEYSIARYRGDRNQFTVELHR